MTHPVRSYVILISITGIAVAMIGQSPAMVNQPARTPCLTSFTDQQSLYTAGKPFVATWTDTTIQKHNDGTELAPVVYLIKMARDSSGKVHVEGGFPREKAGPYRSFRLDDPISGTTYWVFENTRTVMVDHHPGINSPEIQQSLRKMPWLKEKWTVPLCATYGPDSGYDPDEFTIQDLGTRQILGTDAQGILAVRKNVPVTEELWYSSDLQIALIARVHDSRFGTTVREVKSLELDPDPSLFRIPAGYILSDSSSPHSENR
jgi:hypothetical protein